MHRANTDIEQFAKYQPDSLEKRLLNDFQHNFPLISRPFQKIAEKLNTSEEVIIDALAQLQEQGFISRVGAVFRANSVGASTLAAMAVPEHRLEEIAAMVSDYSEVNHNYQREHHFNLWFVLTASDEQVLNAVLDDIEHRSGIPVMYLPMLEDYHIDLGFDLKWT
ncbi:Lrp/AsnC family transcriptional regulator [Sulfuriflexus mobilis]|uniref:Lrp/AsnC family transcriptional regulator n=1 Tax=Sulfuriflexus mobilis TaxID=1811807 RepID=UPI000F84C884|nr:Lrp/AsnC family transcriptional regulator [Sulfuriflexus mobilis]